jgi:hypothetical protein
MNSLVVSTLRSIVARNNLQWIPTVLLCGTGVPIPPPGSRGADAMID